MREGDTPGLSHRQVTVIVTPLVRRRYSCLFRIPLIQSQQPLLPWVAVIGSLYRGLDCDPELFPCLSGTAIQDVPLEQREEALRRGVAPAGPSLPIDPVRSGGITANRSHY